MSEFRDCITICRDAAGSNGGGMGDLGRSDDMLKVKGA